MKFANRIVSAAFVLLISGAASMRASVVVTPSTVHLNPGQSVQFLATGSSIGVYIWGLSGDGCVGISCGHIDATGFYTAPAVIPQPGVITVTATSLSDLSQFGTATVTMGAQPVVGITVSPTQATVGLGAQQQFSSKVTGTSNTAVSWSLSGVTCAGTACGTITTGGLYTAPQVLPNPAIVYVKATSQADSSKSATATVNLISQIKVTVTPATANVTLGTTRQFTAQVTGTTVTGVNWSVSGTGCSGAACGTITSAGLYTAPAKAPNPAVVTVKATSKADSTSNGTATVTLITPIGISISPTSVDVIAGEQIQFHDTVVGTTNTAVTWSVSGATCTGTACGTITSTGLYTAPASIPAQMDVRVTVRSQASTTVSASAIVTILRASNARLNGQYAFSLTGLDKNGTYLEAGSVEADGNGKILSGKEDVNNIINPATDLSITGTYQISSDNRGVLTLHGPMGTQTLRFALNSDGTSGRLISFDQSGIQGSGVIYKQDPRAFDPSVLSDAAAVAGGGYVFSLTGANVSGERVGALGLIFPAGGSYISGSSLDVNEGGVVASTYGPFSGAYDVDAAGRGTMALIVPGFHGGILNFAFYVVSPKQFLMISTDPLSDINPIFAGPAQLQSGAPFSAASFAGPSIFSLTGWSAGGGDDAVGRLQFGSGNTVRVNYDLNAAGAITAGGTMAGAYDMQLNGRGILNLRDPGNGNLHTWLIYATAPNAGYILDISPSQTSPAWNAESVGIGQVYPQVNIPFSNSTLIGTYVLGSDEPIVKNTALFSGIMNFDGSNGSKGSGAVSGTDDMMQGSTLSPGQSLAGTYSVSIVSNNGRGSIVLASPKSMNIAIWAASPSIVLGLQVDDTATHPTVLHIEQ